MHIKYLGGKTNYKKYVHVFFATEFERLDGWLPNEEKLDLALSSNEDIRVVPTLFGYHIYYTTGP